MAIVRNMPLKIIWKLLMSTISKRLLTMLMILNFHLNQGFLCWEGSDISQFILKTTKFIIWYKQMKFWYWSFLRFWREALQFNSVSRKNQNACGFWQTLLATLKYVAEWFRTGTYMGWFRKYSALTFCMSKSRIKWVFLIRKLPFLSNCYGSLQTLQLIVSAAK